MLFIGDVLSRGMGFILLPLYTEVLSTEDFGDWDTLLLVATLLSLLGAHGMNSAFMWAWKTGGHADGREPDAVARSHLASSVLGWMMLTTMIVCGGAIVASAALAEASTNQPGRADLVLALRVALVGQGLRNMTYPAESVLKLRLLSRTLLAMRMTEASIALVGNVVLVALLDMGVSGLAWAFLLGAIGRAFVCVRAVPETRRPTLDFPLMGPLLRYGVPWLPQALAFMLLNTVDRVILKQHGLHAEAGTYSYGDRFARIVDFGFVTPISTMWAAVLFNIAREPDARAQFARTATIFAAAGGMLAYALTLGGGAIARVFDTPSGDGPIDRLLGEGGEFSQGAAVIGVLALGYVLYGMHDVARVGFAITGRTRRMAISVVAATALNIGLNYLWIPEHGAMGAAWATLVAYATMVVLSLSLSASIYPQRWEWGRLMHLGAVLVGGAVLVDAFAPPDNTWAGLAVRVGALFGAPALLWLTGFLTEDDRAIVVELLGRGRAKFRRRSA